jgi:hypothetical protein
MSLWLALHTSHSVHRSQAISLDLLHIATWHHATSSYAMSSFITLVEHLNITNPHHHHGLNRCTCGLITYVSQHKNLLVHISCQSITKTKWGLTLRWSLDGHLEQRQPPGHERRHPQVEVIPDHTHQCDPSIMKNRHRDSPGRPQ